MDNKFAIFAISAASTWNGCGRCTSDELQEAKMLAYKALEKQIPLNPSAKLHGRHYDSYCPVCGKQQKNNYNRRRVDEGWYCEKCGQKLRWEADHG